MLLPRALIIASVLSRRYSLVTVTKSADRRCRWCGVVFRAEEGPGRPRRYCRRSHRQRHYEAQRAAARLGLRAGEVLLSGAELDALRDAQFRLHAALEDARHDLGRTPTLEEYAEAYLHVLEPALAVASLRLEPRAIG